MKNLLPQRGTIVFRLTSRVLLVMTSTFTITNFILDKVASDQITSQIRQVLQTSNTYLSYGVGQWSHDLKKSLRTLSLDHDVRGLTSGTHQVLDNYHSIYPLRYWRVWSGDGKLIATTEKITDKNVILKSEIVTKTRPYFKKAMNTGQGSYQVVVSSLSGRACLNLAEPIYPQGIPDSSFKTVAPIGVASFCLRLTDIGTDSNLSALNSDSLHINSTLGTDKLDLLKKDTTGRAFLLLSNDGYLILPFNNQHKLNLLTPREISAGPYGPIVDFVNKSVMNNGGQVFGRIMLGSKAYFVLAKQADAEWKTVEVYDEYSAFASLRKNIFILISLQVLTLLITAIAISIVCKNSLAPLKTVISAIDKISTGDFGIQIMTNQKGEIALLFYSVNRTALQLKSLLADKLASALNESQIKTAQSIQQSFLIQELPQTSYSQVAASFNPAYEIGADWYDAIEMEGITYTVVADVCDKGVSSALFMSVFRSLLRYTLIKNALEDDVHGATELANVMTLVNNYMASTHGMSTMFATVFASAYDPNEKTLSYVTCGHESPFILRASGELDMLEACGPAIGIFEGASFVVKQTPFNTGDILFAYTDGLVDARTPDGASFGYDATKAILKGLSEEQKHPQTLVDLVNSLVNAHMAGADQFDDLTILAMKAI